MRHKTHTRPDDGQQALTTHRNDMREKYAKTGERGCGLVHAIVSQALYLQIVIHIHASMDVFSMTVSLILRHFLPGFQLIDFESAQGA